MKHSIIISIWPNNDNNSVDPNAIKDGIIEYLAKISSGLWLESR